MTIEPIKPVSELNWLPFRAGDLARDAYGASRAAGWWTDPKTNEPLVRNRAEMMMLMVSELAECAEAMDTSHSLDPKNLLLVMDDHLRGYPMPWVEVADFLIRVGDFCGGHRIDLGDVVEVVLRVGRAQSETLKSATPHAAMVRMMILLGHAMEADRKQSRTLSEASFRTGAPGTVGWNLGVAFVMAVRFAHGHLGCPDIFAIVRAKMDYNRERADHKLENRRKDGGKAY